MKLSTWAWEGKEQKYPTYEEVLAAYRKIQQETGATSEFDLDSSDPKVIAAGRMLDSWEEGAENDEKFEFQRTILFADAGLTEPYERDEVAKEWLPEHYTGALMDGKEGLAQMIKNKMTEMNIQLAKEEGITFESLKSEIEDASTEDSRLWEIARELDQILTLDIKKEEDGTIDDYAASKISSNFRIYTEGDKIVICFTKVDDYQEEMPTTDTFIYISPDFQVETVVKSSSLSEERSGDQDVLEEEPGEQLSVEMTEAERKLAAALKRREERWG